MRFGLAFSFICFCVAAAVLLALGAA